jgi:hypothetical protein
MATPLPDRPNRGRLALRALFVLTAAASVAGGIGQVAAQAPGFAPVRAPTAGAGVALEVYRFGSPEVTGFRQVSLMTLPWGIRSPLAGPLSLELRGAYAVGTAKRPEGQDISLSGFTDTEMRLSVGYDARDWVTTANAVVLLPTGKSTHTAEEAVVAGVVAADLLPFRVVNWGTGGAAGGTLGVVRARNGGSLGFSAAFLAAREFEPVEDVSGSPIFAYRPGDQVQLRAAVDQNVGGTGKITVTLSFQHHRDDRIDGANLYRAGNRYQALGSYAFAAGSRSSAIVYGGLHHRDQGTALAEPTREIPAQNLVLAGGGLRIPFGGGVFLPSIDTRLFLTADGVGEGHLTGAGLSFELPLADDFTAIPSARLRYGRLDVREGLESDITGADVGLSIRWGSPRR